jgi:hypothetical protein
MDRSCIDCEGVVDFLFVSGGGRPWQIAFENCKPDWYEACLGAVRKVRGCRQAGPFQEPFDWRECEVLDYPWIVTNPMDLGTVERELCTGRYCSTEAFARDMRLIFSNAMVFNSDVEDPIHQVVPRRPSLRLCVPPVGQYQ